MKIPSSEYEWVAKASAKARELQEDPLTDEQIDTLYRLYLTDMGPEEAVQVICPPAPTE